MTLKSRNAEQLSRLAVNGIQEIKGSDIIVMDLRKLDTGIADFFVLCSANSDRQVEAIADRVEEVILKATREKPWHTEGKSQAEWVLLDFINMVVHIFRSDKRDYYGLEDLWGDAVITRYDS